MLDILLTSKFYEGNEKMMIDELTGFFVAGFKTTHQGSVNMLAYLSMPKHKARKERVWAEIDQRLDLIKDDLLGKLD